MPSAEYMREYYKKNKHIWLNKTRCVCGKIVTATHKARHEKSAYHKKRTDPNYKKPKKPKPKPKAKTD